MMALLSIDRALRSVCILAAPCLFCRSTLSRRSTASLPRHATLRLSQIARFTTCAVAVVVPCIGLLACLPMTKNNRWKLPLRILFAVVSLSMLILNFGARLSDRTRNAASVSDDSGKGSTSDSDEDRASEANLFLDGMAYVVLASSMVLLAAMAVLFIIFVAFRGAQLQKRKELAANSPIELAENDLFADLSIFVEKQTSMRILRVRRVYLATLSVHRVSRAARTRAKL